LHTRDPAPRGGKPLAARVPHVSLPLLFCFPFFFLFYLIYFLFILLFVGKEGHGLGPRCPGLAICTPHFLLPFFICTPQI
jgi:hypothetical protein